MDWLAHWRQIAADGDPLTLVFPEGTDRRVIAASRRLTDDGLARVLLLGDESDVSDAAGDISLDRIVIASPATSENESRYARRYREVRPKANERVAERATRKPLLHAGLMVACGDADAMIAGASATTARVIEAASMTVGLAAGNNTPSSCFVMDVPQLESRTHVPLVFADCAVNVEPDAAQLADIAIASADTCADLLAHEPIVAMLSFSTHGSARHSRVDLVREAVARVRSKRPDIEIDGELQADAALVPRIAKDKIRDESSVAGRANVLIFPNLEAGNIAYKLTQHLARARVYGPFLQGFAGQVSDLSSLAAQAWRR